MMSAFGVEHTISKSWAKIMPKMTGARLWKDTKTVKHDTMDSKLRLHAVETRTRAGSKGGTLRAIKRRGESFDTPFAQHVMRQAKENKKAAHGIYAAISRNNRRSGKRVLP